MKKITLMLAIAMMAIATTASAQFVSGGTRSSMVADTDNYSRLELGYSPVLVAVSITALEFSRESYTALPSSTTMFAMLLQYWITAYSFSSLKLYTHRSSPK